MRYISPGLTLGGHGHVCLISKCQTGRVQVQVKGEQDAAIRQAEEQAALKHHFKANPLPKSTTQPRWVL